MSGLFVAPITKTFFFEPTPSISVRIWLMTRSAAPPPSPDDPPRCPAMESSSSKKRTHGAAARAFYEAFAAAEEGHRPAYHHRWSAYATNLFDGSDIEH